MAFAQIGLQSKRFVRFATGGLFDLFGRFEPMIDLADDGRQPCVGEREVRVHFDRLSIKISRCPKILQQVIGPRLVIASPQIEDVSVGVAGGFGFDSRFSCGESVACNDSAMLFATSASTPKISVNSRS